MKKKLIILIGTIAVIGSVAYFGTSYYKDKQQASKKDEAITNIENGNYDDAINDLNNVEGEENEKIIDLASKCKDIENAYNEEDYEKVEKLLAEVKSNEYIDLVTNKLNTIEAKTNEKLEKEKLDKLNAKLDYLINNNKFDEINSLLNEYKGLDQAEINKINEKVTKAREKNENLKKGLEEHKDTLEKAKNILDKVNK